MVKRSPSFAQLQKSYLFVEVAKRRTAYLKSNPAAKIISLGIGDTTEPITPTICKGLVQTATGLGTREGYSGYPAFNGRQDLRQHISRQMYNGAVDPDEIFISDGSKPDLGRVQFLFGPSSTAAVQDPVYPAYVDGLVIAGKAGSHDPKSNRYDRLVYMDCQPENNFFPDLNKQTPTDVIYFCSPNNPTGSVASRQQLTDLVKFAEKNKSIIIFDSAYREFIKDPALPRSIFEIEGAKKVAMETSSFSKMIGYTGVRLGWTVVPKDLLFDGGEQVHSDWSRVASTVFNGPSNLAESGAVTAMTDAGRKEMQKTVDYYLDNAVIVKDALEKVGFQCYGGFASPYIWVKIKQGESGASTKTSWDVFQELLENAHLIVTPGVGFGNGGKDFFRVSAFAHREDVEEACRRLTAHFGPK